MDYKRILTIQDISCVGQCSMTVALPILSACGHETAILPSAVLSTHTAGFKGFTFRDLAEDMPNVLSHWVKEGIFFDCIYTGYLGSVNQVDYVLDIKKHTLKEGAKLIVDPAMADNGKLYPIFDEVYVNAMKKLSVNADYIIPNITEACFLTGIEYKENYNQEYIDNLLNALITLGTKNVILTGVSFNEGKTGIAILENGKYSYYEHEKLPNNSHGTGDIYASSFVGAFLRGKTTFEAVKIAADYTVDCIKNTNKEHWYGAMFEPSLPMLIKSLK